MGRRVALVMAGLLVLTGCLGLVVAVPAVQRAIFPGEPRPLALRVTGSWYDRFTVDLDRSGGYAIWATRPTMAPDRDRCQVSGPDGRPLTSTAPGRTVRWIEVATDDTLWTWTTGFVAPAAGTYAVRCRLDADLPGQQYAVTREPGARLTLRLWLAANRGLLVAAVPAGLVILVMTLAWRRRTGP